MALAIGLNAVDPGHYDGWEGVLTGCEPDARDMSAIAQRQGLAVTTLLTSQATRNAVTAAIHDAATRLHAGDLFVLSYSGHGGQVPDRNGDEQDGLDETWCLFDGELIDDELYGALGEFPAGVRVLVLSDSCHSGTVVKMVRGDFENPPAERRLELHEKYFKKALPIRVEPRDRSVRFASPPPPALQVFRAMPPVMAMQVYFKNKEFYDRIGAAAPRANATTIKCSVILISGCKDEQLSADLGTNGLFTQVLKSVWHDGAFSGDHTRFHAEILDGVRQYNPRQEPAYFKLYGDTDALSRFEHQKPYATQAP